MFRHSLAVMLLCMGLNTFAQNGYSTRFARTDSLPAALRNALIDSLNKRMPSGWALPVKDISLQRLTEGSNLSRLTDSARHDFMQYLQQSKASAQLKQFRKALDGLGDSAAIARFADNKLRGFYALLPADVSKLRIPGSIKNKFNGAAADMIYSDSSGATSGLWNSITVQDQLSLGSIPFDLNYSNLGQQRLPGADFLNNNLGKVAFNKEAYLQKLNKHLQSNYDLKKYFVEDIDFRSFAGKLATDRMELLHQLAGDQLRKKITPDQLFSFDSAQLKRTVLQGISVEEVEQARRKLAGLDPAKLQEDSALMQLSTGINRFDAAMEYYRQLLALKKELGSGVDVLKMVNSQRAAERGVDAYVNDAANTSRLARQLLPMGFFERLMLGMKQLNMGNIAASASKGTVSDLFMTGVAGSFINNNKFVMMGVGKRTDIGMQHAGLESSISPSAYATQFIRLGKGDIDKAHTHVTALNASAKNSARSQVAANALARNTFLGAVSKQLELGEWGKLSVELSKSNNRFSNVLAGQQELAAAPKAALAGFLDDFWTTFSTRLNYSGSVKQYGLTHSAYINYAGLGYTNPGNPYAGRGSFQYGLDLKRYWLKNRASVRFKTDVRNMAQSPVSDSKWKNLQFSLDGHYRLNRRFSFDLRLNQASMNEKREDHSTPVFMSRKVAAMMQTNGKLAGYPYSGNAMLGIQQMDYMMGTGLTRNTFVNMNLMKSLFLGNNSLSWSFMYNKDLKGQAIYGNMLSSDITYGYVLLKKITGSSGLTFLNSEQMVRQAGIRQALGAQLLKRLTVNLFVDARKDLYRGREYYYYDNFRTELSIHYLMN